MVNRVLMKILGMRVAVVNRVLRKILGLRVGVVNRVLRKIMGLRRRKRIQKCHSKFICTSHTHISGVAWARWRSNQTRYERVCDTNGGEVNQYSLRVKDPPGDTYENIILKFISIIRMSGEERILSAQNRESGLFSRTWQ